MAIALDRSTESPILGANVSTAFQTHLLSLLSIISQHPSPSFPFPSKADSPQPLPDAVTLTPYAGQKSLAEDAIEKAVMALGERVWSAEHTPSPIAKEVKPETQSHAELLTPEWTPPDIDTPSHICPTCTRPISDSSKPTNPPPPPTFSSASSHPLSVSLSTPAAQLSATRPLTSSSNHPTPHNILTASNGASVLTGGPGAAGWGVRGSVGKSGMSAEKELELLKAQVQDIARVCKVYHSELNVVQKLIPTQAVATGDLTQKIIVPVEGQTMTELKDIINSMVDRLKTFAVEVERVSLEVGTQGKLGGQAVVEGVEGTWRELTAVVNKLAANLTNQVRSIAKVTKVSSSLSRL